MPDAAATLRAERYARAGGNTAAGRRRTATDACAGTDETEASITPMLYIGAGIALVGVITIVASLVDGKNRRERGKRAVAVAVCFVGILLVLWRCGIAFIAS
ncbi:MAG: hypothetical protein R2912_09610 [Eubacteriales bacterium]